MAALPVESTSRLIVDYTWRGFPYSTLYRFGNESSSGVATGAVEVFHTAIQDLMGSDWGATGSAIWYPDGSTISTDVSVDPIAGTQPGSSAGLPDSFQQQYLGRSAAGRRVSWYFQGQAVTTTASQRVFANVAAPVDEFISALADLALAGMTAIDGNAPVIKPYVNLVFNDYLTRKARQGG